MFYAPNSDFRLDGGGSLNSGGKCLMVIVGTLELNGGTNVATACSTIMEAGSSTGAGGSVTVGLVQ